MPEPECPYCAVYVNGVLICDPYAQLETQALYGDLTLEAWNGYVKRIKDKVLPVCMRSDRLSSRITEAEILWKETQKSKGV